MHSLDKRHNAKLANAWDSLMRPTNQNHPSVYRSNRLRVVAKTQCFTNYERPCTPEQYTTVSTHA
jgi:hypothetical protein